MSRASQWTCNDAYFDAMDTSEKWYWLGFLLGDGCISILPGHTPRLQVSLAARDAAHLDRLREILSYTGPLYAISGSRRGTLTRGTMLCIVSARLCARLIELGVTPRKSIVGHPLPVAPARYLGTFARGHFDANGYASRSSPRSVKLGFSGQPRLMRWLSEEIRQHTDAGEGLFYLTHPSCAQLVYARRAKVEALFGWLYESGGPALERKRAVLSPVPQEAAA